MKLISNLEKSSRFKKTLKFAIVVFSLLYVFCLPSFGESQSFLRYLIFVSMALLGFCTYCYCFLYDKFKLNKTAFLIPLFVVTAFVGTVAYSHQFRQWLTLIFLCISFFIFVRSFKIIENKMTIVSIISIAFFLFSLYFIFYYRKELLDFKSFASGSFRLGTYFDNQNGVASYAIIGLAASLYLVLFEKRKRRFVFIAPTLTLGIVGVATGSRTFIIALLIFVFVFLFFVFRKHKWIYLIIVASLIVFSIILLNMPFMATIKDRFLRAIETIFGTSARTDTSTIERVVWTDYGFYLGTKNLLFGYGSGGFAIVSGIGTYSHSNFAELLCDFGIFGFILFYLPLLIIFIKAITTKKIEKSFIIPFFLYYLIVSFSNVFYYKKIYYFVLAFLFYLVYFEGKSLVRVPIVSQLKNIVFTCDTMGSGGAEKVISLLANEMALQNIKVTIIGVADSESPHSFYELSSSVTYIPLCYNNKNNRGLLRAAKLRKLIVILNPDAIVSFLPNANVYTLFSSLGTGIPYFVSERNNPRLDPKGKIIRFLKKISFELSNGCIFQTPESMNYYSDFVQKKSTIINNPIKLNADLPSKPIQKNKIVLAVGRLTKQKNYKCLLDAFRLFNEQKNHSYSLKIYGTGPLEHELRDYCHCLNIDENVVFAGNDNEWHRKELGAAMYVISSDYEGMPNSLAEAMALGIPSISTDCPSGGSRELIKDGINGYLCKVNDAVDLANKMLIVSNESPAKFYLATRNMIEDYSATRITEKWIKFITGIVKERFE